MTDGRVFSVGRDFVCLAGRQGRDKLDETWRQVETAVEIFLDPMLAYEDASVDEEARTAAIGRTLQWQILFTVHVEREDGLIRIISARDVTPRENAAYQNKKGEL